MNVGDMTTWSEVPLSWDLVPSGALARVLPDSHDFVLGHVVRQGDFGFWLDASGNAGRRWRWEDGDWGGLVEQIQIVALGLTGNEPAADILVLMTGSAPSVEPLVQVRASFRPESAAT